jgi:hypothetical protein
MFFIYLIKKNLRNQKNKIFIKSLKGMFRKNFLKILPKYLEKIIIHLPSVAKKFSINYMWLFYEKNFSFFLNIYSNPSGLFFSFEVARFVLKKEFSFKKKKKKQKSERILIFNNFSNKNSKILILENLLNNMLDEKTTIKNPFKNNISVVLIDLVNDDHLIEFRCYNLYRMNLLIPRKLRRNNGTESISAKKKSNLQFSNIMEKNSNKYSFCLDQKIKKIFSLKVIEIGPRFTLRDLES